MAAPRRRRGTSGAIGVVGLNGQGKGGAVTKLEPKGNTGAAATALKAMGGITPAGLGLLIVLLALPALRTVFIPDWHGTWRQWPANAHISMIEVLFIAFVIIERRDIGLKFDHLPALFWAAAGLWLVAMVPSTIGAVLPAASVVKNFHWVVHCAFLIYLSAYVRAVPRLAALLPWAILFSLLLYLPIFLWSVAQVDNPQDFLWTWHMPGFINVRHLDFLLAVVLALANLALVAPWSMGRKWLLAVNIGLIVMCWTLLFWTGARGAVMAAGVAFLVLLPFLSRQQMVRIIAHNLYAVPLGAVLSLLYPVGDTSLGLARFWSTFEQSRNINEFSTSRLDFWRQAFALWKGAPWFGVGAGQSKTLLAAAGGVFAQPHNIILQALMGWGLFGAVPFLVVIGVAMVKAWRRLRRQRPNVDPSALAGFAMATVLLANAMIDASLHDPYPTMLFIIGLVAVLAPARGQHSNGGRAV